jgi:glycerol uptake operon antiterminator
VPQAYRRNELLRILRDYPIIPSLQRQSDMPALISSRARVALISSGSIFDIEERALELYKNNKIVFVHIDLIDGLGRDEAAVKFLKEKAAVDGIVTPNRHLVAVARKQGIIAVHRLFVHDSPSIETGIKVLQMSNPDFIEVLPGLMVSKVISTLRKHFKQPVIGAGLVKTPEEVKLLLDAGAVGVDTSARNLWNL